MATMDVRARIRKTGEERIYPEKVFENICDDIENPLDFLEYVDIPVDGAPSLPPQNFTQQPEVTHQQILIDELIKTRNEKLALEQQLKDLKEAIAPEAEKRSVSRPKKETA